MKGSIVKKGDKYYIVIDTGRDEFGKRKQRWLSGYKSYKEAEKALPRILVQLEDGDLLDNSSMTLEKMSNQWLDHKKKYDNIAATTRSDYENILKHIKPLLGNLKVQEIKTFSLQKYFDKKSLELSGTTLRKHKRLLNSLFIYAIDMELISKNPVTKVKLQKFKKEESKVLDINEGQRLLDVVQKNRTLKMPVTLALLLGLRRGECLALTWDNIDYKNKIITINKNLEYVDKELIFKETKTLKSTRRIAITDSMIKLLKDHYKWQMEMTLRSGGTWKNEYNLVCTQKTTGKPIIPHSISSNFKRFLIQYKFDKNIRFHDLRHTNASIMLAANIAPKIASERLGHSNIAITLDLYSHVLENVNREASNQIEELLKVKSQE